MFLWLDKPLSFGQEFLQLIYESCRFICRLLILHLWVIKYFSLIMDFFTRQKDSSIILNISIHEQQNQMSFSHTLVYRVRKLSPKIFNICSQWHIKFLHLVIIEFWTLTIYFLMHTQIPRKCHSYTGKYFAGYGGN